jgi:hypothetical protein
MNLNIALNFDKMESLLRDQANKILFDNEITCDLWKQLNIELAEALIINSRDEDWPPIPYGYRLTTREWRQDTILKNRQDSKLWTYRMLERASDQKKIGWLSDHERYDALDEFTVYLEEEEEDDRIVLLTEEN